MARAHSRYSVAFREQMVELVYTAGITGGGLPNVETRKDPHVSPLETPREPLDLVEPFLKRGRVE